MSLFYGLGKGEGERIGDGSNENLEFSAIIGYIPIGIVDRKLIR